VPTATAPAQPSTGSVTALAAYLESLSLRGLAWAPTPLAEASRHPAIRPWFLARRTSGHARPSLTGRPGSGPVMVFSARPGAYEGHPPPAPTMPFLREIGIMRGI